MREETPPYSVTIPIPGTAAKDEGCLSALTGLVLLLTSTSFSFGFVVSKLWLYAVAQPFNVRPISWVHFYLLFSLASVCSYWFIRVKPEKTKSNLLQTAIVKTGACWIVYGMMTLVLHYFHV